jgi:hypothetical protein
VTLSTRPTPYVVPTYSLTGDFLAYLTCGLQYRYHNQGALPPSKPVQLWFGQFIHGVLEESFRIWKEQVPAFPWSDAQLNPIIDRIIKRLAARGLFFQRYLLLGIAVERAFVAINTWGPLLFDLIDEAEVHLKGLRGMPEGTRTTRLSNYYEVGGIVDVISSLRVSVAPGSNPLVAALGPTGPRKPYEVVVDYKGMRRPSFRSPYSRTWEYQEWQVLTYAWLRNEQLREPRVRSGMLLYLNELVPATEDMDQLWEEVFGDAPAETDEPPAGNDLQALKRWKQSRKQWQVSVQGWVDKVRDWWKQGRDGGQPFPRMPAMPYPLSPDYRQRRSLRVVPVGENVNASLDEFDRVVAEIEESVAEESEGKPLTQVWKPVPADATCTVCDFRTFCPAKGNKYRGVPSAP